MTGFLIGFYTLSAIVLIAIGVLVSTVYWRNKIRENEPVVEPEPEKKDLDEDSHFKKELDRLRLEKMKILVSHDRVSQKAKSKEEFMFNILNEVQALQVGFDNGLKRLISHDIALDKEDWERTSLQLQKKTEQMSTIVNGSLEMMKYEDMTEIALEDDVFINEFCRNVFDSCQPYLKPHVDTSLETSLDDGFFVRSNLDCLKVLLKYLILCSMEFTTEGSIKLSVSHQERKNQLLFTLNDTGLGIPEEARSIVFDRLPNNGIVYIITGIRLRTCRALARLLGGTIYVDPNYKNGTSVVFSIAM